MPAHALTSRVLAYAGRNPVGIEPFQTEIPGLTVSCHSRPTEIMPVLYQPILCLVLQGAKQAHFGSEPVTFSQMQSVIIGFELPTYARVVEASAERPYVALALRLDRALLGELAAEIGLPGGSEDRSARAIAAAEAESAIVDAVGRLFGLIDKPGALPILKPLLLREIHYWLLSADHGALLREMVRTNSHASRISEAIIRIRRDYAAPLAVPELAREAGMSVSAFHQHFKAICGTTPLQYQKRLRLLEAKRLMVSEDHTVSAAAFAVGYESPTQFSREFTRMFGSSPREHRPSMTRADMTSAASTTAVSLHAR